MQKQFEQLTEAEYDDLVWEAFKKVADDANKAHRRLDAIREGTARSTGLSAKDTLMKYRATLKLALIALDAVIEED